jgi:putative NADPH-quinone reductase
MKALVLRAHPLADSYNAALFAVTLRSLQSAGHRVTPIDLYEDGFDPRLGAAERRDYHDPRAPLPPDLVRYVEALRSHDALVFVFPTWCFGVPAILKGWFDRVFRPGVAFHIDGTAVTPLLSHVRRIAAVTTYGRSRWRALAMSDPPRRTICRYVRWFCARDARVTYLAHYHMNGSTDRSRAAFLSRVERTLGRF